MAVHAMNQLSDSFCDKPDTMHLDSGVAQWQEITSVLAGELSVSHAWPSTDGWPLMYICKPFAGGQPTMSTQFFILSGSINK